jgi:hypothetical protein
MMLSNKGRSSLKNLGTFTSLSALNNKIFSSASGSEDFKRPAALMTLLTAFFVFLKMIKIFIFNKRKKILLSFHNHNDPN